ncbi:hypothetical protein AB1Y20_018042 [Prymnesium parvum]|uniref:NIF system FeS cluster assembly NifU C-terminal domain-containing protein n=1 Tax=Prymnesium parvum TaxID=97485 RepID=A0AB34JQF5_PRYPA
MRTMATFALLLPFLALIGHGDAAYLPLPSALRVAATTSRRASSHTLAEAPASPFESSKVPSAPIGQFLDLTEANVDLVLEEVRPYLVADGGNVAVAGVDLESRSVRLILQGACGSCPSSTVTMKMGIERVLKEKFENLGEVLDVTQEEAIANTELSIDLVYRKLDSLMDAITALGGSIRVVSAADGIATLEYNGPAKVKFGIEMALRDDPLIKEVVFT